MRPVYLGEAKVDQENTPFKDYDKADWALYFIVKYGQIDGIHHKEWVIDQATRILTGTPIEIRLAKWSNGEREYRVETCEPTERYKEIAEDKDYYWSEGTPP